MINALLPPPQATAPKLSTGGKYESSPTYAISGGRNRLRLWEPMTVIFGRHKVVPDLGAKYFTEYVGDDQYLNQVFHFGLQAERVVLSDFRIGDTPISNYEGVQIQVSKSDGKLTMFPGNVDTLTGFVVSSADGWMTRTTPIDTTHISVELAAQLYYVQDNGKIAARTLDGRLQYRKVGTSTWTDIGTVSNYATHYWSLQEDTGNPYLPTRQIDYGSTNAADHTDGETVEGDPYQDCSGEYCIDRHRTFVWRWVPHPHASGQPWYGTAPDPLISTTPGIRITGSKQEITRKTIRWDVPKGQYEVRIVKTTADIKNSRESNEFAVNQILCYQPDTADYTGQLRVAVRIRATNQLNGAIDELSAIAEVYCSVWDTATSAWVWKQNRNPAWWFLYFAYGKRKASGERMFGGGMTQDQYDYDALRAWAAFCDEKGLTFDYVLDRKMSTADMLQIIARAGRASPTWQTGKLGVVWDADDLPVTAMFGPFNIKAGTFEIDYINEGTADEIVGNFINPARNWQMDEVRVKVPGATTTNNPLQLDFEGYTDPAIVGKDCNLLAASQIWHRRRVSWETDYEGWVANRGDVVQISHDLTVWGYSGRLLARAGQAITLDKFIPADGTGILMIRGPENQMKVVSVSSEVGEVDLLTITSDMDDFPLPGDEGYDDTVAMDWAWFFDPLATPGRRFKITEVKPTADGVKFTAIDDDPGYYASENNPYAYTPPRDGALLAGVVLSLTAKEGVVNTLTGIVDVMLAWVLSSPVPADVLVAINGQARPAIQTLDRSLTVQARAGDQIRITVKPASITGRGTPSVLTYSVQAIPVRPSVPGVIVATPEGARLQLNWPDNPDPDVTGYEVRLTDSGWGGPGYLFKGDVSGCLVDPGAPEVPTTWYVRAINGANLYSESSATVTFTADAVPDIGALRETFADTSLTNATITLDWDPVQPQFGLRAYRVSYADIVKTVGSATITLPADWIGDRLFTIQVIDALGRVSDGLQASITKLVPKPPTNVRAQVIDNSVQLRWNLPDKTTLPVSHTHLKSGSDWASALEIGAKKGSFTTVAELQSGLYTYWLSTVDTDGYESEPVSIAVSVSEPPDFVFRGEQVSSFDGTLSSALLDDEGVILPVNLTETWQEHFEGNSWASPQDQVAAGYPVYIQPTPLSGSYQETFDFGTIVASSRVTMSINGTVIDGAPEISTLIETSADGSAWSQNANVTDVFGTNFRYVRFTLTASQSGGQGVYRLSGLTCRLSSKLKNDAGKADVLASDSEGTVANFNVPFLDVSSITVTPAGTTPLTAVYDFQDAVLSGTYSVTGGTVTVNVTGHGLVAGQAVRLGFSNREPAIVTVATAVADSFTAPITGPNGSGALLTYPQGMRIYLFDQSGNRASGTVSWAVKGN